jgi:hypothetical protein
VAAMRYDIIQFPTTVNPYAITSVDQLRAELKRVQDERFDYFMKIQVFSEGVKECESIFNSLAFAHIFGNDEEIKKLLDLIVENCKERLGEKNENPLS